MNITHVNFARGFRGGERQTYNLIAGLATRGMNQCLVCRPSSELQKRVDALGIKTIPVSHPLLGHLHAPAADVIHVHEARGAYWAAIEHALRNTPYIITRRIPNPISASRITTAVYHKAARLIGVSQDVSKLLSAQTGLEVTTILSATTTHAVNADAVKKIRQSLGGGPIIGHVGALYDHHKGQSVLIAAFQSLLTKFPEARLLLLGEGADRASFEAMAKGDPRIHIVGYQQDIGSWVAAMDLFAFPSREEGLGTSVLDAMALRVPVIASSVGGLPELLGNNERGMVVHGHDSSVWAESIATALEATDLRTRQVEAASIFARKNGVDAMATNYSMLYHDILKELQYAPKMRGIHL